MKTTKGQEACKTRALASHNLNTTDNLIDCVALVRESFQQYDGEESELIDGYPVAPYESNIQRLESDPADLLKEAGIQVEHCQRNPRELVVSPKALRAAGVSLEDFVLI